MADDNFFVFLPSLFHWILLLFSLILLQQIVIYFLRPPPKREKSIYSIMTDEERERIKALEIERGAAFDKFFRFGRGSEPSLVLDDFLFLGDIQHASNKELLVRFDIKHVLNVCDLTLGSTITENFNVLHIPMPDEPRTDIKQHFDRTNELLHSIYEKNERCLVHCAAGISRSATIVLAYLMKYHHNTLKEAFFYLMEKRPQIWPNEGFLVQLMKYEAELIRAKELKPSPSEIPQDENPIETLVEFEEKHEKQE